MNKKRWKIKSMTAAARGLLNPWSWRRRLDRGWTDSFGHLRCPFASHGKNHGFAAFALSYRLSPSHSIPTHPLQLPPSLLIYTISWSFRNPLNRVDVAIVYAILLLSLASFNNQELAHLPCSYTSASLQLGSRNLPEFCGLRNQHCRRSAPR